MSFTIPTVDNFKDYFTRDFPYGTDEDSVQDADIAKALQETGFMFNEGLFGLQDKFTVCYLLLSAHNLVTDLQASSQGISGQFEWLQTAKGVGAVSESMQIPQRILDNPELAMLTKTRYGAKYIQLILPQLTGQIYTVRGCTQP